MSTPSAPLRVARLSPRATLPSRAHAGDAGADLWFNLKAMFGPQATQWDGLIQFWNEIYLPYFIGALIPGIPLSLLFYYLTLVGVTAYQKARAARAHERRERRHKLRATLAEAAARLKRRQEAGETADDDGPGSA